MSRQIRTFKSTDLEGDRWQIEARFVADRVYEACLYRLAVDGSHGGDPIWHKYFVGDDINLNSLFSSIYQTRR